MQGPMEVSIIIRTRNEEAFIGQTLARIFKQRHTPFEVIVVDSGSADRTLKIANEFQVKIIRMNPEEFTYGRALNVGIHEAKGDIVVSLSAHAIPFDNDWLANIIAPFTDSTVAGVSGKALPHPDCNPFDRRGLIRRFGTDRKYLHHDSPITFSNACAAARKSVWEDENYDEALPYSEDIKWSRRMMKLGWRFVYEPTAVVYHSHNETPLQLFDRFYNESMARQLMGYAEGRFNVSRLIFDLFAGTAYDLFTSISGGQKLKWAAFSLRRRYWINMGRYFGSRGVRKEFGRRPVLTLVKRFFGSIINYINGIFKRLAPVVVSLTNRDAGRIHPEHLHVLNKPDNWYEHYVRSGHKVLIVGAANGGDIINAAGKVEHVYAADTNRENLYEANFLARWEKHENVDFFYVDDAFLPFSEKAFDLVIDFPVKSDGQNSPSLKEVSRVIKNDGLFLTTVGNCKSPWRKWLDDHGIAGSETDGVSVKGLNDLTSTANRAGLKVLEQHPTATESVFNPIQDVFGALAQSLYGWIRSRREKAAIRTPMKSAKYKIVFRKSIGG